MKNQGKILIIEDDHDVLYTARMILKDHFSIVKTEDNPDSIPDLIENDNYDVILLDMNFAQGATSGREGMEWLKKILSVKPDAKVIMNTAYGDIQLAVDAMKEGAIDFLVKPWQKEKLLATVKNIYHLNQSEKELDRVKSREKILIGDMEKEYPNILTKSKSMEPVLEAIDKVSGTDADVLILGENGTGKDLVARSIHRKSKRANEPFIKVDLGAITESLFESELFGHVKGAFTDAKEDKAGRFEIANGGTLFLDEIGNLSMPLQSKMLSVLQNRVIQRVGSTKFLDIDIRLVSATNQPVHKMIEDNSFRQDLLYRLNTVEIALPPLRERKEDISLLIEHFMEVFCKKYQKKVFKLKNSVLKQLKNYTWPGNIRELQHAVERAIIMSDGKELNFNDFMAGSANKKSVNQVQVKDTLKVYDLEERAIRAALKKCNGNLTKTAEELGFSRSTLYRKMKKYGL